MKILKLKFSNINSLKGSFTIDLTIPAIEQSGIFVIVGPTGAGKTSILDALTLALFGKTPRLFGKSSETEALMTRGTIFSSSEVTIITNYNSKTYKLISRWLRKRENSTPFSKALEPVMMLDCYVFNKSTNSFEHCKEFSTKGITKVTKVIETILGLDFNRFTKTCLLAQNQFSAFLDADTKEKAKILEEITAQFIYSQISIAIHEKLKIEQAKLSSHQQLLSLYKPLTQNELENLLKTAENIKNEKSIIQNNIKSLEYIISKKQNLDNLYKSLALLNENKKSILNQIQQNDYLFIKLELAKKAEPFRYLIQKYKELNSKLGNKTQALEILKINYNSAIKDLESIKTDYDISNTTLSKIRQNLESSINLFKEVRKLDIDIENQQKILSEVEQELSDVNKKIISLESTYKLLLSQSIELDAEIASLKNYLETNYSESQITSDITNIQKIIQEINSANHQISTLIKQKENLIFELNSIQSKIEKLQNFKIQIENEISSHKQNYEINNNKLQEILKGNCINDLYNNLINLSKFRSELENLISNYENLNLLLLKSDELKTKHEDCSQIINHLENELNNINSDIILLDNEKQKISQEIFSLKLTASLDEHRKNLKEGEPCPLCGSTNHPYKTQQIKFSNEIEDKSAKLKYLEDKISKLTSQKISLENKKNEQVILQNSIQNNLKSNFENIQALSNKINQITNNLYNYKDNIPEIEEINIKNINITEINKSSELNLLKNLMQKSSKLIEKYQTNLKNYESINSIIYKSQESIKRLQSELENIQTELNTLNFDLFKINNNISYFNQKISECEYSVNKTLIDLHNILFKYNLKNENFFLNIFDNVQNHSHYYSLQKLVEICNEIEKLLKNKCSEIADKNSKFQKNCQNKIFIENELAKINAQINELKSRYDNLVSKQNILSSELSSLKNKRNNLFGDKNVDEEEQKIFNLISSKEQNFNSLQEKYNQASINFSNLQSEIERHKIDIQNISKEIEFLNNEIQNKLQNTVFKSISDIENNLLPHEEIKSLEEIKHNLENELAKLSGQIEEICKSIKKEESEVNNSKSLDELNKELASFYTKLTNKENELQEIIAKISYEKELLSKVQSIHNNIAIIQQQIEPLVLLDKLIGSSDGKKFLEFAQSITFKYLITAANKNLESFYQRYMLSCDGLEIKVIDKFLYNKPSTVKNLSGGEKFLVSLAFALGLSKIISSDYKIESLFIDEGFGMLDRQTLETALNALSNLQNQGKTIGLITHLDFIKERIPAVIEVIPLGNGYSTLRGCGCSSE